MYLKKCPGTTPEALFGKDCMVRNVILPRDIGDLSGNIINRAFKKTELAMNIACDADNEDLEKILNDIMEEILKLKSVFNAIQTEINKAREKHVD